LENHRSKVFSGADIGRLQKLETNAIIRDNTQLGNRRSMDITSMFAATDDELKIKR
jgi:UDP-3-O-[3-hydroxymyristoyl] glucosamine N-acyltransferase